MKKMIKLLTVFAAAAMGLTSCQNGFEENDVNGVVKGNVVVKFVSEEARTSVDTSGDSPLFSWDEDETFVVLEKTDALAKALSVNYTNVDGKANIDAEFAENADKEAYTYITVYPASGFVSAEDIDEAVLALPSEQSAVEGSYDPNADLMVSMPVTTAEQPTEAQQLRFTRLAAVVEMSINNLSLGAGEEVECVEFTANDKALAGTITADLANPQEVTVNNGVSSVSVATTSANKVYFTVLPTSLAEGDAYSVVVVTNKSIYIKKSTIPEGKSLAFEAGKVSRFGVNMTDALSGAKWKLVRDASALKQNDIVTIVAKNYNYVIGKPSLSVYPLASETEVVKAGSYIYHNPADETANHMMQTYTLMQRDATLNLFDFYNGVDFEGDTSVGFAQATGSNNTPKLQAFCDNSTLFEVGIADGVATITASKISGSYKYWRYYHANSASSRKFDLTYSAVTNDANKILLYRLEGAEGEIPLVKANVTVPAATAPVVIAEEGVAESTAIEEVVFNYVGDWNIAVSDNAEWLNIAYENNCLKYTAEANVNSKRDAVVTITASLDGQESLTWTFNMLQKGAPEEVSIAEFNTKSVDLNVTYKLTGRIVTIPDSATDYFVLADADENQAKVRYLKTESGENVKGNVDVREGDVITVTTVVTNKTGQGGNSTYPSYYKGHYRLAVSASLAADYTGGAVAIEVATSHNGSIELPTTPVSGTMDPCDYATFAYTDGAESATVSFTSENTTSEAREAIVTFTYGLASASVTVQQGVNPANKIGYELVTDASTLAVGDEVIIVARNKDKALGVSSSTITSQSNFPAVDIAKTGTVIYDADKAGVQPFTLVSGNSDGKFGFQFTHKGEDYYLYVYSSNGLRGRKVSDGINDRSSYTITIDSTSGSATILESVNTRYVKFNGAASGGTTFINTTATNAAKEAYDVCIYKKQVK